eukprot:SAG31_NODE_140_length_22731_cov_10.941410_10_plen_64_part_00
MKLVGDHRNLNGAELDSRCRPIALTAHSLYHGPLGSHCLALQSLHFDETDYQIVLPLCWSRIS